MLFVRLFTTYEYGRFCNIFRLRSRYLRRISSSRERLTATATKITRPVRLCTYSSEEQIPFPQIVNQPALVSTYPFFSFSLGLTETMLVTGLAWHVVGLTRFLVTFYGKSQSRLSSRNAIENRFQAGCRRTQPSVPTMRTWRSFFSSTFFNSFHAVSERDLLLIPESMRARTRSSGSTSSARRHSLGPPNQANRASPIDIAYSVISAAVRLT